MLEEVVNTSNSLEDLFKENDFEFINALEGNIDDIHVKILEQKSKRRQVIELLNSSRKDASKNDNNKKKKYRYHDLNSVNLYDSNEIILIINSNIKSLYSIEVKLNDLCQNFTDSYVTNFFRHHSDSAFDSIKKDIASYSKELAEFNKNFKDNNEKVDKFLADNSNLMNNTVANLQNTINKIENINSLVSQTNKHADNPCLIVSEQEQKVFLPYKASEIADYLNQYPTAYTNFEDVIEKEFILSLDHYTKNPVMTRFRETYALIRDREAKSVLDAFKYSFDLMFRSDLNPAVIAACKNQQQLEDYIYCLDHKNLEDFKHFKIEFNVSPLNSKI